MECKELQVVQHGVVLFRINRNIVECKERKQREREEEQRVLIET